MWGRGRERSNDRNTSKKKGEACVWEGTVTEWAGHVFLCSEADPVLPVTGTEDSPQSHMQEESHAPFHWCTVRCFPPSNLLLHLSANCGVGACAQVCYPLVRGRKYYLHPFSCVSEAVWSWWLWSWLNFNPCPLRWSPHLLWRADTVPGPLTAECLWCLEAQQSHPDKLPCPHAPSLIQPQ